MDRAFRRAVLERLTVIDELVEHAGPDLPLPVARTEIRRITEGWRELLLEHQPDASGRCPVCSGWLRRRKWPCQVWITAHQQLIGETTEVPQPRARLGSSFRRPREVEVVDRRVGRNRFEANRDYAPRFDHPAPVQIHRAAVIERIPTMPRQRLGRRPRH